MTFDPNPPGPTSRGHQATNRRLELRSLTISNLRVLLHCFGFAALVHLSIDDAAARTWRVSKSGDDDFTVVQHAVNAAAPGDSILIGPGWYSEVEDFQLDCCLTMPTYLGIPTRNLTLIGADRDSVVIGPPVRTGDETVLGMRVGASRGLVVQDLTLRNATYGMRVMDSASVARVRFADCWIAALAFPDSGASFTECTFDSLDTGVFAGSDSREVRIVSSSFSNCNTSINFTWSERPRVDNCVFSGSGTSRVVASGVGTRLVLTNCTIEGGTNYGVAASAGAELLMLDNYVYTTGGACLWGNNWSKIEARRNRFEGGWFSVLRLTNLQAPLTFVNNQILKGAGPAVVLDDFPEHLGDVTVSLQNNYWNTTEVDSVRAWIADGNDDPTVHGFAAFEPILDSPPVPTEHPTVGRFKSTYAPRNPD